MVDITGSTQNDLSTLIRRGEAAHGDVLVTEFQSAGRGRLDRSFVAQPGTALLFSFCIIPAETKYEFGWLPLLAGQALCSALEEVFNIDSSLSPQLKWPNDVLLNDRKIAGVLTERIDTVNGLGVVIGVGLNFYSTQDQLPIPNATSLAIEGFTGSSREQLLVLFLVRMSEYLVRWESEDFTLLDDYRDRSATVGRDISIELPNGEKLESRAISIDRSGALVLDGGRRITVGDVVHLRIN